MNMFSSLTLINSARIPLVHVSTGEAIIQIAVAMLHVYQACDDFWNSAVIRMGNTYVDSYCDQQVQRLGH